ncbi:hypothetical protein BO85DRAFT_460822 [Aspergillus piperis CBS 112811]|uniref:Uncharacterized protein n=1 Tax=Aspergillus piperis CBS 112811 TaxID=1448313 RepID=A0A8G1VKV0_9EURO|nr:hypothetical protein BO85DRAFT_460822 [Aspergillus piperis CBS 112811]RAH55717.1 hypothetical protein BO85DRAFT_460822 [Aspergillus piperis CBS 112811]
MAVAILHQTEPSLCAACGFYRNGRNGNYEAIESWGLTSHVKRTNSQACRRSHPAPAGPEFIRGEPSAQGKVSLDRIESAATRYSLQSTILLLLQVLCRSRRYGDTRARVRSVDCIMRHAVGSREPFPVDMPAVVVSLTNSVVEAKT